MMDDGRRQNLLCLKAADGRCARGEGEEFSLSSPSSLGAKSPDYIHKLSRKRAKVRSGPLCPIDLERSVWCERSQQLFHF